MKTIKEINRLTIDVLKAIVLIRLMFKLVNSYDIPVDIVNIPSIGIINKDVNNILRKKIKKKFPLILYSYIIFISTI